jgi:peptide-methionine (S)-S-oxide reductase
MAQFEKATFGTGCFWCSEAVFKRLEGVNSVVSGYSGGTVRNPTYEQVCSGKTGHAEVVQISFDPKKISYEELLDMFWSSHDPTTLNRQGADVGTQYRSVIFFHDEKQREAAEKSMALHQKKLRQKIVTEIKPFEKFYKAEDYHQDYYLKNKNRMYCRLVIFPKLRKLKLRE